ncbi:MAG: hypothetical protein ACI9FJ_000638 [Alteromonadaceae bacterium]|jgi:hypothetical protein
MVLAAHNSSADTVVNINEMSKEQRKGYVGTIIDRMMLAYGVKTKKELAAMLGCVAHTPSNWTSQATIPWLMLDKCHHQTGISMDWLLYGMIDMQLSKAQAVSIKDLIGEVFVDAQHYQLITPRQPGAMKWLMTALENKLLKLLQVTFS